MVIFIFLHGMMGESMEALRLRLSERGVEEKRGRRRGNVLHSN